jgi:hypothetical protein
MHKESIQAIIMLTLLVLLCAGWGSCLKWQYDECINVGHGTAYCTAQTAGCFSGGRR